ncbi:[protein-PII] uridylyltransferase [Asticcacaulis endophyticus]|uniref:Bifunctional uridylyltransferase/uridylyl-removing enzyme n=1 Tax=Asticcacaulis endophyticus TaxID=1395890 RepID=A0A918UNM3_9CAUL|nr:[protein-PII] uridylyltransferase [Asticcacaulis endophyticus]GGZ24660.1 bifunctional uridylyltransferase/uridylyl-removing enzyme [Asticcacaulis endophyticus]
MLTHTHPHPYQFRINGQLLRQKLTQAYEDSTGDVYDLRRRAIAILKEAWDQGRESILANIDHEKGGLSTARAVAKCADEIISALWDFTLTHVYRARNPTEGERLSLVAVGGYGRGELAPYSDIDLLFLRAWRETPHSESVIEFILYSLWDLGFKVGHASRTVDETLKYARDDHTILTAVLEFRPIAGDLDLVQNLKDKLASDVIRNGAYAFIAAKLDERDNRHAKLGDARYVVEPNVKEGKGGLRDLHTLFWLAKFLAGTTPSPVNKGWFALETILTDKERTTFLAAFEFLWKVRILLHIISGRGDDRLGFDVQPEIAQRMGYIDKNGEPAVERFMRRYFVVTKEVGALTRIFCTKLEAQQTKPLRKLSYMIQSSIMSLAKPDHPGFIIDAGRLSVQSPDIFIKSPEAMFSLFKMADRLELDLHPDAFTAINRNLKLINPALRRDPKAAKLFLDILVRGKNPYRTLSLMTETGLLGRYIPEFGHIVAQTQFNMYHAYTVDDHTLRAIGIIRDIETGRYTEDHPLSSSILPHLADKETLYLAMLLHDVGKGGEDGQEIGGERAARKACDRLGLKDWQIDQVAWLVRNHLVLSDFAQKRDVSDPETIAAFARIVETPERLRLLLVLTVADIRAVGPGVWNGWKGQLMRDLLHATEAVFRGGREADAAGFARENIRERSEAARTHLMAQKPDIRDWLATMEDSYVVAFSESEVLDHAVLARSAEAGHPSALAYVDPKRNATALSVAARDRPGLFADLSRALANLGANVVGAQVFTSKDGLALDIFYVQDIQGLPYGHDTERNLKLAQSALEKAAVGGAKPLEMGRKPLAARMAAFAIAPTVVFDDDSCNHATIIEVSGRDRSGLLADIVDALSQAKLNIASAHIDCYGERAVDAFYVNPANDDHAHLNKSQKSQLKKELLKVLDPELKQTGKVLAKARASLAR